MRHTTNKIFFAAFFLFVEEKAEKLKNIYPSIGAKMRDDH